MSLAYDILPVTLVTGFLGSGKSTLLADVLTGEAARDTAVLVNEFGEIGLDHLLMGEVDAQTVLLDNGCVCCSIRGELKEALAELFSKRARGDVPAFSRVVIETTGLATPAPIIATLLADPVIRSHYALNVTVTVVDAVNAGLQRERYPEWLAQISATDRIVISKTDLTDTEQVDALRVVLTALNPLAEIVTRAATADALRDLLFTPARHVPDAVESVTRLGAGSLRLREGGGTRLSHRSETSTRSDSITSACLTIDTPIDWQVFTLWFTLLLNRHGDKILRVKGLLSLEGSDRPAVLHAVQHLVHPVLHLDAWPDDSHEPHVSRLVFITEGIEAHAIDTSYRRFCAALQEAA
ncbi:CobW family GTP-binding protein [Paraburkholderia sp. BCC1886]|uniref:CobW family GTP-binding protein n=1 Tax=Paraburkholderia sp. BCC1886 TaxID=2562670 RepID=UPI001181D078|nr:GTP-binding protein [Paraburkholderia sp. BCC1886]